ncbi:MAG: ABC transporter permease [Puniceicoccales bacterium]|jgi:lipoprotein-releasing system permease protein|nr:ABC transporter permease [Puniceicoccales bacterium]
MHWSTYLAFKSLFPSKRGWTFFTIMSIIGVTLGVAVLVVVESVINGFQADIRKNMLRAHGEIRVEGKEIIENARFLEEQLCTVERVQFVAPYVYGTVMMVHGDTPAFPVGKGIDVCKEATVTDIRNALRFCSLEDLDENGIILGERLATRLGVQIGDSVEIYTPLALEAMRKDSIMFPREVHVIGFFSMPMHDYDQNTFLCSLSLMQDLYGMENGVHGFTVKTWDGQFLDRAVKGIRDLCGDGYEVIDWIHGNGALLFALRWEKTMMFFVLLFILLVASFSIASTLITNVIRKKREIGLVIAIGGGRYGIARCFCIQGLLIGICGTLLGIGSGLIVLYFRDSIVQFITWSLRGDGVQNYLSQFVQLPVEYQGNDFLLISMFSLLICMLSGIIPGRKAARINAATALHCE